MRWLLLVLAVLAVHGPAAAQADADLYLRRGVSLDGQLWLLTDSGGLFRIEERRRRRVDEQLPEAVLDICRSDGQLLALTGDRNGANWTVRGRRRGLWRVVARIGRGDEGLLALDCSGAGPVTLVTTSRLIEMRPEGPASIPFTEMVFARVNGAVRGTRHHVYVGLNSGEWGGGLVRVDRATGQVRRIERDATDDRFTAARSIRRRSCTRDSAFAVAAGMRRIAVAWSFQSHGRIAEVCGERVESLYSKQIPLGFGGDAGEGRETFTTEAFFGVVPSGQALLAAGTQGLYRIGRDGLIESVPYPRFREVRGVWLNFDRSDVILVVTQINRRASVSGGAPLIVPR